APGGRRFLALVAPFVKDLGPRLVLGGLYFLVEQASPVHVDLIPAVGGGQVGDAAEVAAVRVVIVGVRVRVVGRAPREARRVERARGGAVGVARQGGAAVAPAVAPAGARRQVRIPEGVWIH